MGDKRIYYKFILIPFVLSMGCVGACKTTGKIISLLPGDMGVYSLKLQCRGRFMFNCENDSTVVMRDTQIVYTDAAAIAEINAAWNFVPYGEDENHHGIGSTTHDFVVTVLKDGVEYDSYTVFTGYKALLGVYSQRNDILKPASSNHCTYFTCLLK